MEVRRKYLSYQNIDCEAKMHELWENLQVFPEPLCLNS